MDWTQVSRIIGRFFYQLSNKGILLLFNNNYIIII